MTNEITERVAEQARKWQQLSQLLRDPEIAAFLAREFSRNGNSPQPSKHEVSEHINTPDYKRGDVIKTVTKVCKEFLPNVPFTAFDVLKRMRDQGFVFAAKSPEITINGALRKLVHKYGKLRIHIQGSGRRASRYVVVSSA
jgi:hypothetical protein